MRRTASAAAALALVVGVVAAGALAGAAARNPTPRGFSVSGHVTGLYPGSSVWLRATVRNPYARPLRVLAVSATVGRASRGCRASNLDVRPFRGEVLIPARAKRVVRLRVSMAITAAPECAGARFPLSFSARGVVK